MSVRRGGEGAPELQARGPHSALALALMGIALAVAFVALIALGTWQVQRLAWKRDLIAQVEARVHAPSVAAPGPAEWPQVDADRDAYRRVHLDGRFLPGRGTRVQAVTSHGAGFWLLEPFQRTDGSIVLVNRGFVPPSWSPPATAGGEPATRVTGLLRISEPGGGFLRRNAPDEDRWHSRDVAAIASARGLERVAPYFVDAERDAAGAGDIGQWPAAGLTTIRFANNHLPYALTWFALALMVAAAAWRLIGEERRLRAGPDRA